MASATTAQFVLEIRADALGVEDQLAEALLEGLQRDQGVAERDPQVAGHGRVREVPLQARDRQLGGQVFEQGVGDAQVALGVLEVDRVHLVRHGRRPDFARRDLLLEIVERDVAPEVAVQVDQDGVDPAQRVAEGGQVVVVLDLGGRARARQPQRGVDELVGEGDPVDPRVGDPMRVEIARGPAELGRERDPAQLLQLGVQPFDEDMDLLAEAGRRGGLAVGPRQHRDRLPLPGPGAELRDHGGQRGLEHLGPGLLHGKRNCGVVDVLGGQAEVDELAEGLQAELVEFLLEPVLDRLDVVVGDLLDVLDALRVLHAEAGVDRTEPLEVARVEAGQLRQRQPAERDEVLDLDPHAVADQGGFGEVIRQAFGLAAVAAVDRGNGLQGGETHRGLSCSR